MPCEKRIIVEKENEKEEETEEAGDPLTELREKCHESRVCQAYWAKFQDCTDRVTSRKNTAETCEDELIDYVQARDKCVSKDLFKLLK